MGNRHREQSGNMPSQYRRNAVRVHLCGSPAQEPVCACSKWGLKEHAGGKETAGSEWQSNNAFLQVGNP